MSEQHEECPHHLQTITSSHTTPLKTRIRTLHASPSSDVYLATLDGRHVVVKRTKLTCPADLARFDTEAAMLNHARGCDSLVAPIALWREPPTYAIVLPHYERGSLFALLHASGRALAWAAKLSICADVAAAVTHLHSHGILHRDVKTDNVLVDASGRGVLADLNAAEYASKVTSDIVMRARPTGGFFKQFVVGTLPYMAPELLRSVRGAKYTASCDTYSFGIALNEVLAQQVPYADAEMKEAAFHTILEYRYNHDSLVRAITTEGLRPEMAAAAMDDSLRAMVTRCWSDDATARPAMGDVAVKLAELLPSAGGSIKAGSLFADEASASAGATLKTAPAASDSPPLAKSVAPPDDELMLALARRYGGAPGAADATAVPSRRVGWEATSGRRGADRMEDRCTVLSTPGLVVAGMFDGHNGDAAAEHCRQHLVRALHASLASQSRVDDAAMAAALATTFPTLHDSFVTSLEADQSGCTALAAVCTQGAIHVANAGDCRCVLWRAHAASGTHELVSLNVQHNAGLPDEARRIEAAGSSVSLCSDGKRRVAGVIEVTRCIGDQPLRQHGLISEPEVRSLVKSPADVALVLATDGLWDVIPDERVLHCLRNTAKSPDLIAKRLLHEALDRGTQDNVSVVVVLLQ